jgi:hypothetical protein
MDVHLWEPRIQRSRGLLGPRLATDRRICCESVSIRGFWPLWEPAPRVSHDCAMPPAHPRSSPTAPRALGRVTAPRPHLESLMLGGVGGPPRGCKMVGPRKMLEVVDGLDHHASELLGLSR